MSLSCFELKNQSQKGRNFDPEMYLNRIGRTSPNNFNPKREANKILNKCLLDPAYFFFNAFINMCSINVVFM